MKLQALTVSVNYSDFLVHVIEENKKLFDKWVIVTDLEDYKTKKLCDEHGLTCVQTNAFYERGIFNKFAGINEGLKEIDADAYVLFLDSDIILPWWTRRVIEELHIDPSNIYGIDRLDIRGGEKFKKFKEGKGLLHNNWLLTNANLPIGSRLIHLYGVEGENGKFGGWNPLGFFQLCHRSAFDQYPENSLGADHCDLVFSKLFPREKRVFIPEIYGLHLLTESESKGVNWYGRRSKPFIVDNEEGPTKILKTNLLSSILFIIGTCYWFIKK
jgi:hypothetical protein